MAIGSNDNIDFEEFDTYGRWSSHLKIVSIETNELVTGIRGTRLGSVEPSRMHSDVLRGRLSSHSCWGLSQSRPFLDFTLWLGVVYRDMRISCLLLHIQKLPMESALPCYHLLHLILQIAPSLFLYVSLIELDQSASPLSTSESFWKSCESS